MAYADFAFYQKSYFGDVLTEENAAKWLSRASDELDAITFGRLTFAFPTNEAHAERVRKSVCAVADALCQIDAQRIAMSVQKGADGGYHGTITAISSGKESVSYSMNNAATVYGAAAASTEAQNKLICTITAKYLANIPDTNGVNLLYAGGVSRVQSYDHGI